jgi:hypothetical protein
MAADPEQESEELEDEIIARLNPETAGVENLEVLFFSTGLLRGDLPSSRSAVAANGYLSSLLPVADRVALRRINVELTRLAIRQCAGACGVANQIVFDTLICEALALFFCAHDVSADRLLALSRDFDAVFLWSLAYGNARTTFNARFVRFPLAVVFPCTVEEVVFWVGFVREHRFSVSIRSGNNCYESFDIDNEIVIDLTFLVLRGSSEQFQLEPQAGVVHVAPGVRLGVLYTELARLGFAFAGGQCSPVCIGGLVATGGAGLGIITRLTVQVVPTAPILFYTVSFKLREAATVLAEWQNLAAAAPDALSSVANIAANASSAGTGGFFINGEFRVDPDDVPAARRELETVLRSQWLKRLPPPLDRTPIEIETLTTVEAATLVALEAPMPIFN